MITVDIHAELIAAFLGDDEPRYGECQCASCLASRWGLSRYGRIVQDGALFTRSNLG
jgi:hypothetical protein